MKVMFTGGVIPSLCLADESDNRELLIEWTKHVMPTLASSYHWCGIFDNDGKLIWECNFDMALVIKE